MMNANPRPSTESGVQSGCSPGYNLKSYVEVLPDTRNHMGFFVSEETYTFIEETEAGWAYICVDDSEDGFSSRCHFVNPEDIRFIKKLH
jgi:hypothetical protein